MRTRTAIAMALLVTTALVGGVAAPAAGVQPTTIASPTDESAIERTTDDPSVHQTDDACGFPLEITDATGTTITLDEAPERITTINPSAAQTLWELGEQDRVVGVTQYAAYLDGASERTNVSSSGFGVSIERVVATEPDLVLAPNASAGQVEALREQDLTVYHFAAATSIEDIATKTETTGRLVGNCEAAAETNAEMNEAVEEATNRTAGFDRPNALYPLGDGFVAANGTFINSIIEASGATNVAAAEGDGYPQLSNEVILQTDPDLILVTTPDAAILDEEPYASTTAGTEGNYVVMDVNYLNQPAPRSVIESTTTLSTAIAELQAETDGATDGEDGTGDGDDAETDGSDGETEDDGDTEDGTGESTDDSAPGFGIVAALVATIAAALTARRP
jgi:iron complex transport system substrate-binding protein